MQDMPKPGIDVLHLRALGLNENRMPNAAQRQTALSRSGSSRSGSSRSRRDFLATADVQALLALFGQLPDVSFFLKDRAGRFIALNRRGCDYCGVKDEADAIDCTDRDFFPRRRADDYMRDDEAVMTSGEAILDRVESAPEGEASPRLVLTSKVPVRDRRGRVIGVAGISRTVEQLRAGRQQLGRLNLVATRLHEDPGAVHRTTDLAKLAGLSASQFERTFRRAFGTTPHRHLLRLRIETACRRLRESDDSIATIAVGCGFADHAHFTRTFRRAMGMSPTEYRKT
jgi:AraC-like DNA-binding protein